MYHVLHFASKKDVITFKLIVLVKTFSANLASPGFLSFHFISMHWFYSSLPLLLYLSNRTEEHRGGCLTEVAAVIKPFFALFANDREQASGKFGLEIMYYIRTRMYILPI